MILSGGKCKNCGHKAKSHHDSFPPHGWVVESCYECDCHDYKDGDKYN